MAGSQKIFLNQYTQQLIFLTNHLSKNHTHTSLYITRVYNSTSGFRVFSLIKGTQKKGRNLPEKPEHEELEESCDLSFFYSPLLESESYAWDPFL